MKIRIEEDSNQTETEVIIRCTKQNSDILNLVAILNKNDDTLICKKEKDIYQIHIENIMYIESIDERIFVYLQDELYETQYKLYELENLLEKKDFIRISKSCLLHFKFLKSVRALFNGKYEATLVNGEKLIISRSYMNTFRKAFGI